MGKLKQLFSNVVSFIKKIKPELFLFSVLLISVFLLPGFRIKPSFPEFQFTDVLFPILVVFLFFKKQSIVFGKYVFITCGFIGLILLSIIINKRYTAYNDYFEIYKFLKFIVFVVFISQITFKGTFDVFFKIVFYLLFVFNLFHYFDLFHFNARIEPYYASGVNLDFFGLNSIGQIDTKRMIGTLGNPNNNAIAFLFFVILFLPKSKDKIFNQISFYLSFIGFLACQSRTAFIVFGVIYVFYLFIGKIKIRAIAVQLTILVGVFLLMQNIDRIYSRQAYFVDGKSGKDSGTKYLTSLMDGELHENTSINSRFETWQKLVVMIKQKPILGHSPNKQYFYDNNLYSENEYILILWRYGMVGFIFYLIWLLYPFFIAAFKWKYEYYSLLIYFSMVICITSLTNNPLSEPRLLMVYALVVGLFFKEYKANRIIEEQNKTLN